MQSSLKEVDFCSVSTCDQANARYQNYSASVSCMDHTCYVCVRHRAKSRLCANVKNNFVLFNLPHHSLIIDRNQNLLAPLSQYSMARTKTDPAEEEINKILSAPENSVMAIFVNKKAAEVDASSRANARIWFVQFFYYWCGKDILNQVRKNQRKMDTVYKYWSKNFFEYFPKECFQRTPYL